MGIIVVFLSSIALSVILNKKNARTFAVVIMTTSLLLYFGNVLDNVDFSISLINGLAFLVICSSFIIGKKRFLSTIKYNACEIVAITFFISFFAYYSMGRGVYRSADLNTWAYLVKAMYYSGDIFIRGGEGSYPRATMLWNLFANKTWIGYSESISLWAQNVFTVSLLLPFYRFVDGEKKAVKGLILGGVILLLPLALTNSTYSSLFPDTLLGLMFVYCIIASFNYFNEKDYFCIVELVLGLYSLTLTKRIGIVLAATVIYIFTYLALEAIDNRKKQIVISCILTGVTFIFYVSWNGIGRNSLLPLCAFIGAFVIIYSARLILKYSYAGKNIMVALLTFAVFVAVIAIDKILFSTDYVRILTNNYIKQFMTVWESYIGFVIKISLGSFMVIIGVLVYLYANYIVDDSNELQLSKKVVALTYAGNFIYLFLLWIEYVTVIGTTENNSYFGIYATSFERYVIPCYISLLVLVIYLYFLNRKSIKVWNFLAIFVIILLTINANDLVDYMFIKYEQPQYYGFKQAGITLTENDKVYFIDEHKGDDTTDSYAFMYAMYPAYCDVRNELYENTLKANNYDYISPDELAKKFLDGNYTYVYIQSIDDQFINLYGHLFEDKQQIGTGFVYAVINSNGRLVLSRR